MLDFFLSYLPEKSSFLNLFSYLSTRTILSTLSALMIVLFFGDKFIEFIRSIQFKQKIDDRGPKSHKVKDGTPTMGGLLIIGSVLLSGLLWGDLQNKYLLISLFTIFSFGLILFLFNILLVLSVEIFGKEINGSKRWLDFGFLSLQPSEFMKISYALFVIQFIC